MAKEIRKVKVSGGELAMALNAYRKLEPEYLPPGKVVRCDVHEDSDAVEIEIEQTITRAEYQKERRRLSIPLPKITEPLIYFCIDNHIMLPRRGKKSGIVSDGSPALFIELETLPVLEFD
jgi:hypothetical protein